MLWYIFEYPLFARCKESKMGIPIQPDEPIMSLHDRVTLKPYEVYICGEPVTMHCYSMNHALKLASNLPLTDDDVVRVEFGG